MEDHNSFSSSFAGSSSPPRDSSSVSSREASSSPSSRPHTGSSAATTTNNTTSSASPIHSRSDPSLFTVGRRVRVLTGRYPGTAGTIFKAEGGYFGLRLDNNGTALKRDTEIEIITEEEPKPVVKHVARAISPPIPVASPAYMAAKVLPTPAHVVSPSALMSHHHHSTHLVPHSVTQEVRRKRPSSSKLEWTQGQQVLISHGKGVGRYATVIGSGHGFIAVSLDGKKMQKRVSELDLKESAPKRHKAPAPVAKDPVHEDVQSAAKLLFGCLQSDGENDGDETPTPDDAVETKEAFHPPAAVPSIVIQDRQRSDDSAPQAPSTFGDSKPVMATPYTPHSFTSGQAVPAARTFVSSNDSAVRYSIPAHSQNSGAMPVPAISIDSNAHPHLTHAYSYQQPVAAIHAQSKTNGTYTAADTMSMHAQPIRSGAYRYGNQSLQYPANLSMASPYMPYSMPWYPHYSTAAPQQTH